MTCATCGDVAPPETEYQVPSITKFAQENTFILYSMEGCPFCEKVKDLMRLTNQQYVVYTLDQHFTIEAFEEEFGTKQFPQVVADIKGQDARIKIGGAAELAQYFKENSLV
tara:strand:+ start:194 stop:526 length:333 start_codon:yes stop_codon:yes gene_type:complete